MEIKMNGIDKSGESFFMTNDAILFFSGEFTEFSFRFEQGMYETQIHYNDVRMGAIASQITSDTVYSDADQKKHQSSASQAFVPGEFSAQMVSNAENVSILWGQHVICYMQLLFGFGMYFWLVKSIGAIRICLSGFWYV